MHLYMRELLEIQADVTHGGNGSAGDGPVDSGHARERD